MKYLYRILFSLSAAMLLCPAAMLAQSGIWFRSAHDISSSLIKQVFADSRGMIWVATDGGLNRFDGSKFTIYRNNKNDSTSIASNTVDKVFEDSKGNLFVISFNGIQLYDYGADNLSPVAKRIDGKPLEGNITSMVELPSGEKWTLGRTPMRIEITPERELKLHPLNLPREIVLISDAIADRDGGIWLAKSSEGIFYRNSKGEFKKYLGAPGDPVIFSMTLDNDGNLFAGCINTGLYRFDKKTDRFVNVSPALKNIPVKSLTTAPDGKIMVGTDKDGLYEYNPQDGTTRLVSLPYMDSNRTKVHSVAYDRFGNRWMGIFQKGVLMIPPQSEGFQRLTGETPSFSSFSSSCVNSILEDREGMLWVGTDNDGIYKFDAGLRPVMHLRETVPSIVTGLLEDSKGRLWISSYGDGVGTLNKVSGIYSPLHIVDKYGNVVKHSFGIVEDNKGNLWISTMGSGLFKMDASTGNIKPVKITKDENLWIPSIYYSKSGDNLYLGSYGGLHIVSLDTKDEKIILPGKIIYAVNETLDGEHWVATSEGLARLDKKGNPVKVYSTEDGLPSSTIYSVDRKSVV